MDTLAARRIIKSKSTTHRIEKAAEGAVFLAALATVPLIILQEQGIDNTLTTFVDWCLWGIFLVDYVVMLSLSTDRWRYVRRNWLAGAIIILSFPLMPALLEAVRVARLTRVLRLLRFMAVSSRGLGALRRIIPRPGLMYYSALTAVLILAGGSGLALLEPEAVKGDFWNGIWWAVVTTTTVGYGDVAPVSLGGRLLAAVLMFTGIGLVGTLAASISAYFVRHDAEQNEPADLKALEARMASIETLLRRLVDASGEDKHHQVEDS